MQNFELKEPSQDGFPDGGLFDSYKTLPYLLGDDPDTTLSVCLVTIALLRTSVLLETVTC